MRKQRELVAERMKTFHRDNMPRDLLVLDRLLALIDMHFKDFKEQKCYCDVLGVTPAWLNKVTKFYLGKSVFRLMQDRLYQEAEKLLAETILTVKEVTFDLDICDPAHFARQFKLRTGMTPGAFRLHCCASRGFVG